MLSAGWYIRIGRPHTPTARLSISTMQQVINTFPSLKSVVFVTSFVFFCWMQVWNAAVYGCWQFEGSLWLIVVGFVTTTMTAAINYSLIACTVFVCFKSWYAFLSSRDEILTQNSLDAFKEEAPLS